MNGPDSENSPPRPTGDSSAYAIEVRDDQERSTFDCDRLCDIASDVLRHEGVRSAEISVALIDGNTMRRLNREHLGHDYDTDVLSFLLDCKVDASETVADGDGLPRGAGKTIDGEILISTDVADDTASRLGSTVEDEVTLYLVHGLLHLAGYDDLTPTEMTLMRQRERFHLNRWKLDPVDLDSDGDSHRGETIDDEIPNGDGKEMIDVLLPNGDCRTGGAGR